MGGVKDDENPGDTKDKSDSIEELVNDGFLTVG
jgi:hypothetical protein